GDTKWTAKERKNILTRRNLCVQTVMLCLTSLSEEEMLGYLQTLKDKGYYPYKHIAWNLRPKISLKRVLVDYSLYLFPNEKYYLWFYRKFKKK
ncbi:MAG: hypothetical protein IKA02_00815, partial [Clostridia bacterium]|nr:hypothetical protein [Clostridia bacterium]